jgi:hypothetical protein
MTGTADRAEAERYLLHRMRELREIAVFGIRPRLTFREAGAKYLDSKSTIQRDAQALKDLDPYVGHLARSNQQRLLLCISQCASTPVHRYTQCKDWRRAPSPQIGRHRLVLSEHQYDLARQGSRDSAGEGSMCARALPSGCLRAGVAV